MGDGEHPVERPVRVALSNDYEIALLGLAQMLARHPDRVQVVGLTSLSQMPHDADVILYDTFGRLPDNDDKLRMVVNENSAKVVVYSWEDYPEEVARGAGAAGYLHKGLNADELVAAIVGLHNGHADDVDDDSPPSLTWPGQAFGLSEREAEMLTFIARGLTNEQIARRSFISVNTVKTYIRIAYRKIGVTRRAQAVAWCFQNGFNPTSDIDP